MFLFAESPAAISPTIAKLINFAIYLAILVFLLRKPLAAFFASRSAEIETNLQRAQREKQAALAQLKTVEERLNRLDDEVAQIRSQAAQEAEAEYARVIAGAREDAARLEEMARREIQSLTKAARLELKSYAAEQAVSLAEGVIRREMQPADAQRIVGDYINDLERVRQ